ncbi:hypothetical protein PF008_g1751 [Phytophthora fragariae]|uniref:Uncharacterized protein n=1 Tax=Phytophthora fragariae TaxID=53985 RepID=A0A6G0SL48_9STRA|nr:hypothetical protein PF008_g1751 [Phytophthora fragariae]
MSTDRLTTFVCRSPTFKGYLDVLAAVEKEIFGDLMGALEKQRELDAGTRGDTTEELQEELDRVTVLHEEY